MNPNSKQVISKKKYLALLKNVNKIYRKQRKNFKRKNKPTNYKNNVVTYGSGKTVRYFEYETQITTGLNTVNLETILDNNADFMLMSKIYTYAKLEAVILTIPPIDSTGQVYSNIYWENPSGLTEADFKKADNVRITNLHSLRYRWRYFRPLNTIINYDSKAFNLRNFIQTSQLLRGTTSRLPGKVVMCGTTATVRIALKFSFRNANYASLAVQLKNKEEYKIENTNMITFKALEKKVQKKKESVEVQTEEQPMKIKVPKKIQDVENDERMSSLLYYYNKFVKLLVSQIDATSDYLIVDVKQYLPTKNHPELWSYIYKKEKNWIDHVASVQSKLALHLASVNSKYSDKAAEQFAFMFGYLSKLKTIQLKLPIEKEEENDLEYLHDAGVKIPKYVIKDDKIINKIEHEKISDFYNDQGELCDNEEEEEI